MPDCPAVNQRAVRLKCNLLRLAKSESDPDLRNHLTKLARLTRLVFEGLSPNEIKAKLLYCFEEYFDGETAGILTLDDLEAYTCIPKRAITPVLAELVIAGVVISDVTVPDYHQWGDHSIEAFCLNPENRKRYSDITANEPEFKMTMPAAKNYRKSRGRKGFVTTIVKSRELPNEAFTNA